jgi:hypothetical protein
VVPFSVDLSRGEADGFGCKVRLSPHQLRKRTSCLNLNRNGTMSESLSVELSSCLIVNDLRLTGRPERQRWITMPGPEQIPGLRAKGSRSGPTSSNSERKRPAIGFRMKVLQLTLTERQEAFVSGEQ